MLPLQNNTCECATHGYCKRYNRVVGKREHELCQTRQDYRELFARQAGKHSFPPLIEQAINLFKSIVRIVDSKLGQVHEQEYAHRLSICSRCDRYKDGRCLECGCFVALKAVWSSEDCPLKPSKWPQPQQNQPPSTGRGGCGCGS